MYTADHMQYLSPSLKLDLVLKPLYLCNQITQPETDSMQNGNRTPSIRSQSPIEPDPEDVKDQAAEVNKRKPATDVPPSSKQPRPSVKPKPPPKKQSESPVASSSSHVTNSSGHVTSSSSHASNSSDHVTSSSSRVSQVIERMEASHESKSKREHHTLPTKTKTSTMEVKLPPVRVLEQNAESARSLTKTTPSPNSSPGSMRRRAHSAHSRQQGDEDVATMLDRLQRLALSNDYYALLGVEASAGLEELTKARRDKSRLLHPDHFAGQPDKKLK